MYSPEGARDSTPGQWGEAKLFTYSRREGLQFETEKVFAQSTIRPRTPPSQAHRDERLAEVLD